jgi:hypothetical protein
MGDGRELVVTVMHLKVMLTHLEGAQKTPEIFELAVTDRELEEVLEPLEAARQSLSDLHKKIQEEMEPDDIDAETLARQFEAEE